MISIRPRGRIASHHKGRCNRRLIVGHEYQIARGQFRAFPQALLHLSSALLQSRPYLRLFQQCTVQFRDAGGMTEALLCDQIEFPHRGLERDGRLCIQLRLVDGPGGFAGGPLCVPKTLSGLMR
jgi:hypothetical protein